MKARRESQEKDRAISALVQNDVRYRRYSIEEIEEANFISEKIGYIGKSADIVSRTYSIRASVNGKATYHNCGAYIKRKLDTIPFEEYVVKYLYCPEDKIVDDRGNPGRLDRHGFAGVAR